MKNLLLILTMAWGFVFIPKYSFADGGGYISTHSIVYTQNFESGGLAGWSPYAVGSAGYGVDKVTVNISSNETLFGKYSVQILGNKNLGDGYIFKVIGGLVPKRQYTFSAYFKAVNAKSGNVSLNIQTTPGHSIARKNIPTSQFKEWTRVELPFTPEATSSEFDVLANNMHEGELYIDGIMIESGNVATKFISQDKAPKSTIQKIAKSQTQTPTISDNITKFIVSLKAVLFAS